MMSPGSILTSGAVADDASISSRTDSHPLRVDPNVSQRSARTEVSRSRTASRTGSVVAVATTATASESSVRRTSDSPSSITLSGTVTHPALALPQNARNASREDDMNRATLSPLPSPRSPRTLANRLVSVSNSRQVRLCSSHTTASASRFTRALCAMTSGHIKAKSYFRLMERSSWVSGAWSALPADDVVCAICAAQLR